MVKYGFCYKDNIYDSVRWQFRLDIDVDGDGRPRLGDMVNLGAVKEDKTKVQDIRFKRHQLNVVLLGYIRRCFRHPWARERYADRFLKPPRLFVSKISNLEFESKCLERYEELVDYII